MPELPEVETVRRGLEQVIMGGLIAKVRVNRFDLRVPVPANLPEILENQKITRLVRRGKYIIFYVTGAHVAVLHLGMSGRIDIIPAGAEHKIATHDHIILTMQDGVRVVYNDPRRFGMFYVSNAQDWEKEKPFSVMGPEPLSNDFNGPLLLESLKNRSCSIKSALLDQTVVAGVGNIYACESLYQAGISPFRAANHLNGREAGALCQAVQSVLLKAIENGGSSLKDYRKADGSPGYFQHSFAVYNRAGRPCPTCDCDIRKTGGIQRAIQSGRSSFYCPRRQVL